jgi:hypothetical protein
MLSTTDGFHDPALRYSDADLLSGVAWWRRMHHGISVLHVFGGLHGREDVHRRLLPVDVPAGGRLARLPVCLRSRYARLSGRVQLSG